MPFIPLATPSSRRPADFPIVSPDEQSDRDAAAERVVAGEFSNDMSDDSRATLAFEYQHRFGKTPPPVQRGFIPLASGTGQQPVSGFVPLSNSANDAANPSLIDQVSNFIKNEDFGSDLASIAGTNDTTAPTHQSVMSNPSLFNSNVDPNKGASLSLGAGPIRADVAATTQKQLSRLPVGQLAQVAQGNGPVAALAKDVLPQSINRVQRLANGDTLPQSDEDIAQDALSMGHADMPQSATATGDDQNGDWGTTALSTLRAPIASWTEQLFQTGATAARYVGADTVSDKLGDMADDITSVGQQNMQGQGTWQKRLVGVAGGIGQLPFVMAAGPEAIPAVFGSTMWGSAAYDTRKQLIANGMPAEMATWKSVPVGMANGAIGAFFGSAVSGFLGKVAQTSGDTISEVINSAKSSPETWARGWAADTAKSTLEAAGFMGSQAGVTAAMQNNLGLPQQDVGDAVKEGIISGALMGVAMAPLSVVAYRNNAMAKGWAATTIINPLAAPDMRTRATDILYPDLVDKVGKASADLWKSSMTDAIVQDTDEATVHNPSNSIPANGVNNPAMQPEPVPSGDGIDNHLAAVAAQKEAFLSDFKNDPYEQAKIITDQPDIASSIRAAKDLINAPIDTTRYVKPSPMIDTSRYVPDDMGTGFVPLVDGVGKVTPETGKQNMSSAGSGDVANAQQNGFVPLADYPNIEQDVKTSSPWDIQRTTLGNHIISGGLDNIKALEPELRKDGISFIRKSRNNEIASLMVSAKVDAPTLMTAMKAIDSRMHAARIADASDMVNKVSENPISSKVPTAGQLEATAANAAETPSLVYQKNSVADMQAERLTDSTGIQHEVMPMEDGRYEVRQQGSTSAKPEPADAHPVQDSANVNEFSDDDYRSFDDLAEKVQGALPAEKYDAILQSVGDEYRDKSNREYYQALTNRLNEALNSPDKAELYSQGGAVNKPHDVNSARKALLDAHNMSDRAALKSMLDNGKANVITSDDARNILGDRLYSHTENGGNRFARQVSEELAADNDAAFKHGVTQSKSLEGALREVAKSEYHGEHTRVDERDESGADHRYVFTTPTGKPFHVYESDDGRVWIDVSKLEHGGEGQSIYAAVANYAHNAHKIFVGDPNGVSKDAMIRRTSNMLSSALRFGTTRHLEASKEQLAGDKANGIEPLSWSGTDIDKVEALIHTFVTTAERMAPEIKKYGYDFQAGRFTDGQGRPITGAAISSNLPRVARIGEASARRAVFLKSLISGGGEGVGERSGILEQVLRWGDHGHPGSLDAIFSRGVDGHDVSGNSPSSAEKSGSRDSSGVAKAFYNPKDGKTYFIADHLSKDATPAELRGLVRHEIAVHALNLGKGSKQFSGILKNIETMRNLGNKYVVDAYKRVPSDTAPEHVNQETLAYLIQHSPELGIVKHFIGWFREQLRSIGFRGPYSVTDVRYMAQTALSKSFRESYSNALNEALKPEAAEKRQPRTDYERALQEAEMFSRDSSNTGHDRDDGTESPWKIQRNNSGNQIISGRADSIKELEHQLKREGISYLVKRNADGTNSLVVSAKVDEPTLKSALDAIRARANDLDRPAKVQNAYAPGVNHVGMINDSAQRTSKAADSFDAVNRDKPITREEVLAPLLHALDATIYQGRVKGANRLGYYRPNLEEIRIKKMGDIEVAAHEIAHLLDDRIPEIRRAWLTDKGLRDELRSISYDHQKVNEGYAEGMRLFLTQPEALEDRAPRVYDWIENFTQNHEYGPALKKAQAGMTAWFGQDGINRARSKIGYPLDLNKSFDGLWDRFRQSTVDDLHGIMRMEQDLTGKLSPVGAYESARLSRASQSIADGAIRNGYPVKKPDGSFTYKGKGLEEILKPLASNLDDSLLYFVGKSAAELMKQGREHLFTPGEVQSMLGLRTPERDAAFKEYQTWNKGILDFAEAHGVINPDARAQWQRTQYMPFHRVGTGEGAKGKPGDWSGIKALTGGTDNLRDILGNMTANAAQLIDKAVKNEARQKVAALSAEHSGGRFMVKIDSETRPVKLDKKMVLDGLLKTMGIDRAKNLPPHVQKMIKALEDDLASNPGMMEFFIGNQPPAGGNVVAVLNHGKPTWYEVADPILYRALSAIDRPVMPWIVKWLGLPKRVGQVTITLTPDFMLRNIARDTIMGAVMSRAGFVPIMDSLKGMKLRLTNDPLYKDYIANGGGLASIYLDESKFRAKLEKFYSKQGIDYRTVLDSPAKMLNFIEHMSDAFEMSTRLGEYQRAIAQGVNPRHAAYLGREVSTDFAMSGDSRALCCLYNTVMFLRPAVLSLDRLYRGFTQDPNKGAIAIKAGMVALMSIALYLQNRNDPRYQALNDWDRDTYWHFFIGNQHFRYPKIWEIGAMASVAERSVEKMIAGDPMGLGKDFIRIVGNTFGMNYKPQVIAPLIEQAENRSDFTNAPIETPGMENVQPFLRAKPWTSETLKAAGMATRNLPEALQVNPVRAEALLRGYFNTWALYGLTLSDRAFFNDKLPTSRTDQMPVVRSFYSQEPPEHTKYETQFYDMLKEAKELTGTLHELDKIGMPEIADQKERNPMAGESFPLERAAKNLQGINQDMRLVQRSNMTPDEKRQKLDALTVERNSLLKETVEDAQKAQAARK